MKLEDGAELIDGMTVWAYDCRRFGHRQLVIPPYKALYVKKDKKLIPIKDDGTLKKYGIVASHNRKICIDRSDAVKKFNNAVDRLVDSMKTDIDKYLGLKVKFRSLLDDTKNTR